MQIIRFICEGWEVANVQSAGPSFVPVVGDTLAFLGVQYTATKRRIIYETNATLIYITVEVAK